MPLVAFHHEDLLILEYWMYQYLVCVYDCTGEIKGGCILDTRGETKVGQEAAPRVPCIRQGLLNVHTLAKDGHGFGWDALVLSVTAN